MLKSTDAHTFTLADIHTHINIGVFLCGCLWVVHEAMHIYIKGRCSYVGCQCQYMDTQASYKQIDE